MRVALRNPFARAFRREAPFERCGSPPPAGVIFHMSRCGSTLVAQMLAAIPRNTVISEAAAIDEAIQARDPELLRSVVGALRRGDGPCVVKFDAWHIHSLPLIRKAFPDTPWVFRYRDPVEALISHSRSPGRLALPGAMDPVLLGLRMENITALRREEWCVRALAGFYQAALRYCHEPRGLFLNYNQLPTAIGQVAKHFSIPLSDEDLECMRKAARYQAKSPSLLFEADSESKQREASPAIRELCAVLLDPLYRQLDEVRAGQAAS